MPDMEKASLEFLEKLLDTPSPSGCEEAAVKLLHPVVHF